MASATNNVMDMDELPDTEATAADDVVYDELVLLKPYSLKKGIRVQGFELDPIVKKLQSPLV